MEHHDARHDAQEKDVAPLRPDVTACATGDGMVLLDERTGRYWQLNSTGALAVTALLDGAAPGQVADRLAATRPVPRERARRRRHTGPADIRARFRWLPIGSALELTL
ncbi:lasso peptide biosynthesis PqqD family chaperone [Streptomyces purpurascens]|uniref:Lasso peptide biosynthesis PqqD family chaperone n=1 Tax=Streptomyces purpurascens TaxID=1924 RepID=A0ABZ1MYF1_STREF